jgi:hypothetical protein
MVDTSFDNPDADLGPAVPRLITQKPQICINGLRHGITGQNTFLTNGELLRYLSSGAAWIKDRRPIGVRENHLLQRIIDTDYRLGRIPFIEENLQKSAFLREAQKIRTEQPELSEDVVEIYAQADAFRVSSTDIERLSRHETRLSRLMQAATLEYERLQERRMRDSRMNFILEASTAYNWYVKLTAVAQKLMAARDELKQKSQIVVEEAPPKTGATPTESAKPLLCKNRIHIVTPLTEETEKSLAAGHAWGLLTEVERTLFPETQAA